MYNVVWIEILTISMGCLGLLLFGLLMIFTTKAFACRLALIGKCSRTSHIIIGLLSIALSVLIALLQILV